MARRSRLHHLPYRLYQFFRWLLDMAPQWLGFGGLISAASAATGASATLLLPLLRLPLVSRAVRAR